MNSSPASSIAAKLGIVSAASAGGILLIYLASSLYNKRPKSQNSQPNANKSQTTSAVKSEVLPPQELVNKVFPFSFMPSTAKEPTSASDSNLIEIAAPKTSMPTNSNVRINYDYFDALANALKDVEYTREAVFSELMLNKIHRLLTETTSIRDTHSSLWLLLHCLILLGSEVEDLVLNLFSINFFLDFLQEKQLDAQKAKVLFGLTDKGYYEQNAIYPTEAFLYPIEIVWLAYAIISRLYASLIVTVTLKPKQLSQTGAPSRDLMLESLDSRHFEVLKENMQLYSRVSFQEVPQQSSSSTTTSTSTPKASPELIPQERTLFTQSDQGTKVFGKKKKHVLSSEYGMETFTRFLRISVKVLCCDDISLVQLSLNTFGQFFANVNASTLAFLLFNDIIEFSKIFLRLILCTNQEVLQTLGKCIFTAFLRSRKFLEIMMTTKQITGTAGSGTTISFVNEVVHLALLQPETALKLQYMNLLYLMLLASEPFCMQVITNKQINILLHICSGLISPDLDVNFASLQLLYGLTQHSYRPMMLMVNYSKAKTMLPTLASTLPKSPSSSPPPTLFQLLKRHTFAPQPLLRYYSLLIWYSLCRSRNDKPEIIHQLRSQEQLLNVLMFVLKEERELKLKNLCIQILNEICQQRQASNERILLLSHFNLLFELVDIFKFNLNYIERYLSINNAPTTEAIKQSVASFKYVQATVLLLMSVYKLFQTLVITDQEAAVGTRTTNSNSSNAPTTVKQTLLEQYDLLQYIDRFVKVLKKLHEQSRTVYSNEGLAQFYKQNLQVLRITARQFGYEEREETEEEQEDLDAEPQTLGATPTPIIEEPFTREEEKPKAQDEEEEEEQVSTQTS